MSYRELRLALSSKISLGNKLLDLDLVPREEDGRPADPDQQGIAHLFNVVSLVLKPYLALFESDFSKEQFQFLHY